MLYDGVCGLCNRFVQFTLRRDRQGIFRFASLQSPFAKAILAGQGISPDDMGTIYVLPNSDSSDGRRSGLLSRSDAVAFVLKQLGGIWSLSARLIRLFPRSIRDAAYGTVARNRYRLFGRYESCPIPSETERARFLDL